METLIQYETTLNFQTKILASRISKDFLENLEKLNLEYKIIIYVKFSII